MFTLATYGAQALLFVAGILQKRLLGPTSTGYWALMTTFAVIFNIAPIGSVDGASRQIPFHRGRGDRSGAAAVANTAATFGLFSTTAAGLLLAAAAFAFGSHWNPDLRYGLVLLGLIAPLGELRDAHETIMQTTKRFDVSSMLAVAQAVLTLIVTTGLVWWLGFYGMFAGQAVVAVGALVIWHRLGLTSFAKPAFRWAIDRARLRELIRFGLPMMLQGQLWVLFLAVDNLIVAAFLSVRELGYYAVACSATSYIMILPRSIGGALGPRLAERFAQHGDVDAIRDTGSAVQDVLAFLLLPLTVAAAFFLMPVLVRHALPQFDPAIPVMRIIVAGSFFISLTTMPIKVLLTTGYRWSVTSLTLATLVFNGVANYVAVGLLHDKLTGAAAAVVVSYFVTFATMTGFAETRTRGAKAAAVHIAEICVAFLYTAGVLWGLEAVIGHGEGSLAHDVLIAVVKLALTAVAVGPWMVLVEIRTKGVSALLTLVRNPIRKVRARRPHNG